MEMISPPAEEEIMPSNCGILLSRIILRIAGVTVMISKTGIIFSSMDGTSYCEMTACSTMDNWTAI